MVRHEENQLINGLWLIAGGGGFIALVYSAMSLLLGLTILGWPFAVNLFETARFASSPFGKTASLRSNAFQDNWLNTIWKYSFGMILSLIHIILGSLLVLSVIGFPFGVKHFQLVRFAVAPFYLTIRPGL
jgi:uncharacterized membrane protein YccF (DUF307 family)